MEQISEFKDRKGSLIFFGILEIIIGFFAFLFFLIMLLSMSVMMNSPVPTQPKMSGLSFILIPLIYLFISAIFISLGIGSIKLKRWARSLSLLISWFTLFAGIGIIIVLTFFMGGVFEQIRLSGRSNEEVIFFVKILMYSIFGVFLILLPVVFILFYRSSNVIKTVQKYDLKERWTDKVPLPVLALCFLLLYTAITPPFYLLGSFGMPFIGFFLSGWLAVIIIVMNSAICIYLVLNVYKLRMKAWYYSLFYYVFGWVSTITTFMLNDVYTFYHKMNMTPKEINNLKVLGITNDSFLTILIYSGIPYLLFLIYTKRFFKSEVADENYLNTEQQINPPN